MRRKFDIRNKRSFIVIMVLTIVFIIIFSLFIVKYTNSLKVDYVHVLVNGKIVKTGGQELASDIEENGYAQYK